MWYAFAFKKFTAHQPIKLSCSSAISSKEIAINLASSCILDTTQEFSDSNVCVIREDKLTLQPTLCAQKQTEVLSIQ